MTYKPKKYEWDVLKTTYGDEIRLKRALKKIFNDAIKDLNENIQWLYNQDTKSKIYQAKFQEQVLNEINNSMNMLSATEVKQVKDYLKLCYSSGYASSLFCLNQQGIPYAKGFRTAQIIKVLSETKLSEGIEKALYKDIEKLKKPIRRIIINGIATDKNYTETAQEIEKATSIAKNRAMLIARTEGHRVAVSASFDAMKEAADVIEIKKQWCATLDDRTRESHRMLDGELVDLDEEFSNGLMYPGDPNGDPEEVINCRCVLLERPTRMLSEKDKKEWEVRSKALGVYGVKDFGTYRDILAQQSEDV